MTAARTVPTCRSCGGRIGTTDPPCGARDVTEPFEMDGYAGGAWHASGLWWIVCRECKRSTLLTRVDRSEPSYSSASGNAWDQGYRAGLADAVRVGA